MTLQDLLLPPAAGRQAILCAETREACTALLRGIAADLAGDSEGPDPVALLIDPSPEELADWRREAPQAEIVAAGQARHASDALAQASARASSGDDVILLVDSLTRLGEAYERRRRRQGVLRRRPRPGRRGRRLADRGGRARAASQLADAHPAVGCARFL